MPKIELIQGDCLEKMKDIPDKSIDMILCDLPYGTTGCTWDEIIPFEPLWNHYKRIIKNNGAIVLFGSQPFTSKLIMSNIKWFKYEWVWDKVSVSNPQLAKIQPLKHHENILVFSKNKTNYFPQDLIRIAEKTTSFGSAGDNNKNEKLGHIKRRKDYVQEFTNYPRMLIKFPRDSKPVHPTQKPVALLEYLIKTYTNENDLVLDNCMGSGTTGVACINTNRNFIGIELDPEYFKIAEKRINENLFYGRRGGRKKKNTAENEPIESNGI